MKGKLTTKQQRFVDLKAVELLKSAYEYLDNQCKCFSEDSDVICKECLQDDINQYLIEKE